MERSITLAVDVAADSTRVFEILSTTEGQRSFWTAEGYSEVDLGHTAQTWALILARLAEVADSGAPRPFFPEAAA